MADNLVLVRTERQYTLASTFLRFQEHYESPKFRDKIFSLEEFMDWYAIRFGNFTYYQDWSGFNIPSSVLKLFREGKFNPLSKKEQRLLRVLADTAEPFYIVGIFGKNVDLPTLKHELVHGLFYTVPEYRADVLRALKNRKTSLLEEELKEAGYHPSVYLDEANAYLMMGVNSLRDDGFRWTPSRRSLQKELQQIFHCHFRFSLRNAKAEKILKFFKSITL